MLLSLVTGDGKHNTMSRRIFRFQFRRKLIKILFRETGGGGHNDTYAGIDGVVVLKGELLIPSTYVYRTECDCTLCTAQAEHQKKEYCTKSSTCFSFEFGSFARIIECHDDRL